MFTALGLGTMLAISPAGAQSDPQNLEAPYQVDGFIEVFDTTEPVDVGRVSVLVDLGTAENQRPPDDQGPGPMTVIGTEGFAVLPYGEIQKHCDYLCGTAEGETCHYVGIFDLSSKDSVGRPLAAVSSADRISNFKSLEDLPEVESPYEYQSTLRGTDVRPLWDPHASEQIRYRLSPWDPKRRGFDLETLWAGSNSVSEELSDCRVVSYAGLDFATCQSRSVILDRGRPLIVDFPDYNVPSARPMAAFDHQGIEYIVFELGLKAQTVYGLLFRTNAGWQARVRPRDYPGLC